MKIETLGGKSLLQKGITGKWDGLHVMVQT